MGHIGAFLHRQHSSATSPSQVVRFPSITHTHTHTLWPRPSSSELKQALCLFNESRCRRRGATVFVCISAAWCSWEIGSVFCKCGIIREHLWHWGEEEWRNKSCINRQLDKIYKPPSEDDRLTFWEATQWQTFDGFGSCTHFKVLSADLHPWVISLPRGHSNQQDKTS